MHGSPSNALTLLVFVSLVVATLALTQATPSASLISRSNTTQRHLSLLGQTCTQPPNSVSAWKYNAPNSDPQTYMGIAPNAFSMLNAYVYGGKENVHWKCTNDPEDLDCLKGWTYYDKDCSTVLEYVPGTLTVNPKRSKKTWCAMKVYRIGGVRGKQWEYCQCRVQETDTRLRPLADGCTVPMQTTRSWYYNNRQTGPFNCTFEHDKSGKKWTMLNAYRSGGKPNKHWKYTDDPDDPECLVYWTYYGKDGVSKVADIQGSLTTIGDKKKKNWCALPVYRSGGKQGYQWDYCICP